jgi:hypothetical protein
VRILESKSYKEKEIRRKEEFGRSLNLDTFPPSESKAFFGLQWYRWRSILTSTKVNLWPPSPR